MAIKNRQFPNVTMLAVDDGAHAVIETGQGYKFLEVTVDGDGKTKIIGKDGKYLNRLKAPIASLDEDTLSWTEVEDANSYTILVDGVETVTGLTTTSYDLSTIPDLEEGTYGISVKAVNENYKDGKVSNTIVYEKIVIKSFAEESWDKIRSVTRSGQAAAYWSVGDTKDITLTNDEVMTYRIADLKTGRYDLSDGTGASNMVLEPVTQIPNTTAAMNSSGSNSGGFAQSQMRSTTLANIYALFPTDVQNAMSEVVILSGTGGGTTSGTSSSNNKLFLPAETEMFSSATYSIGSSESPSGQFDYYAAHNTAADRIKQRDGSNKSYWLRSPYSGNSSHFCYVDNSGSAYGNYANATAGVAPCFAI